MSIGMHHINQSSSRNTKVESVKLRDVTGTQDIPHLIISGQPWIGTHNGLLLAPRVPCCMACMEFLVLGVLKGRYRL